MRKLIYGINLTADGCCDHTKGMADEEIHDYFTNLIRDSGLLIYGRKTYQLMVPFWPALAKSQSAPTKAMNEFARVFDSTPKVVFSRTVAEAEDKNTRIVRSGLREEIMRLKAESGKDMLLGGVDLSSQLVRLGLVDEYFFVIQPIIVGKGRRLFDTSAFQEKLQLKLVDTKNFKSGSIALHYRSTAAHSSESLATGQVS
ncbi:MAG: dihydrofolate reductase family protein [Verrucomicrobia bacterium]|nr:dihydrofolate reductase family protein [Verrucomicrobiota bacterium]